MTETPISNVTRWGSEEFLDEGQSWVARAAARAGLTVTGDREQSRVRPWSSAVRFGADGGALWFKVNGVGTRHEGGLVAALAAQEPSIVPGVVAIEPERGWFLTRDAGPIMRDLLPVEEQWSAWEEVVPRYAEAQVRLAEHGETVLATGVPVASPTTLPGLFRDLVEELGSVPVDDGGLDDDERSRLTALCRTYDGWCAELGESGVPDSIQHDDLHSGNVCWVTSPVEARVIDWGDASWGSPLATLLVLMNSLAWHAGCELDDRRVTRVRDAYLEPFTAYADRPALLHLVDLVRRTGCVTRALSYRAALAGEPVATHREHDFPVRGWLLEVLEG